MQFTILSIFLAVASLAAAAPTESLEPRETCVYATANYVAACREGICSIQTGICTGNSATIGSGFTESFTEAGAVAANTAACVGVANGKGCVRTAACCK